MADIDFKLLIDGIRVCFPAITRDRFSVKPCETTYSDLAVRVAVIIDERFPTFDADGLMTLVDADEMTTRDGHSTIKGAFAGKPCEIILLIRHT